jgi:hypothetical protein
MKRAVMSSRLSRCFLDAPLPALAAHVVRLLLLVSVTTLTNLASAAEPAYLAKMPTPEQVEAKIHGSDPIDTAVRQAEALGQLCSVIRSLSQGGEFGNRITPEEIAKCSTYQHAATAIAQRAPSMPAFGPESWAIRTQRYHNDSFRAEVLAAFPGLEEAYVARKGAEAARRAIQNPGQPRPPPGFGAVVGGVGILLLLWSLRIMGLGRWLRIRGDKVVVRKLDGAATRIVPHAPGLVVEHLCIGAKKNHYSYTAPVTTSGGYVSGGGTQTSAYLSFDFGWAVQNETGQVARFQVTLVELDSDGYALNTKRIGHDIQAGEKRRIWAGLSVRKNREFEKYTIKEMSFGPGPIGKTEPGVSVYEAFALGRAPLERGGCLPQLFGFLLFWVGLGLIAVALLNAC